MEITITKKESYYFAEWNVECNGKKYSFYLKDPDLPVDDDYKDHMELFIKDGEFTTYHIMRPGPLLDGNVEIFDFFIRTFERTKARTPKDTQEF